MNSMTLTEKLIWNAALDLVKSEMESSLRHFANPFRCTAEDPLGQFEKEVDPVEAHVKAGLEIAMRNVVRCRK
jgi:hypothetical protein